MMWTPLVNDKEKDRRYRMAEILLQPQTSRITHPLEGVANIARAISGQYQINKLDEEYKQRENEASATMGGALAAYDKTQQGGETKLSGGDAIKWNQKTPEEADNMLVSALSKNRDTAPMAMDMQMDTISQRRALANAVAKEKALFPMELEKAKALAGVRASVSAPPAVVQTARSYVEALGLTPDHPAYNQEIAKAMIIFGKTYDKGIIPQVPNYSGNPEGGLPNSPQNPGAQGQATNPAMVSGYENITPAMSSVGTIPGYADAVANIAATKKGAEQDAANQSDLNYKPVIASEENFGKKQGDLRFELPKIRNTANEALKAIDQTLASPGLKNITGWLSYVPIEPGGERARADALMDQIGGRTFLAAYEMLKGGGVITEIEGQKGEQAIATLGRSQSYEDVIRGLQDLRSVIVNGLSTAETMAGSSSQEILASPLEIPPAPEAAPQTMPPLSEDEEAELQRLRQKYGR